MIKGVHVTYYTPKAEELRAFLRDKLGLGHYDAGEGVNSEQIRFSL
jgi:hypothetical protein